MKKITMLTIIEEVANRRIKSNSDSLQINLSAILMAKAVDDVNKLRPADKQIKQNGQMNEFNHTVEGKEFHIINRAYRDDSNDYDVEEILYELATKV